MLELNTKCSILNAQCSMLSQMRRKTAGHQCQAKSGYRQWAQKQIGGKEKAFPRFVDSAFQRNIHPLFYFGGQLYVFLFFHLAYFYTNINPAQPQLVRGNRPRERLAQFFLPGAFAGNYLKIQVPDLAAKARVVAVLAKAGSNNQFQIFGDGLPKPHHGQLVAIECGG